MGARKPLIELSIRPHEIIQAPFSILSVLFFGCFKFSETPFEKISRPYRVFCASPNTPAIFYIHGPIAYILLIYPPISHISWSSKSSMTVPIQRKLHFVFLQKSVNRNVLVSIYNIFARVIPLDSRICVLNKNDLLFVVFETFFYKFLCYIEQFFDIQIGANWPAGFGFRVGEKLLHSQHWICGSWSSNRNCTEVIFISLRVNATQIALPSWFHRCIDNINIQEYLKSDADWGYTLRWALELLEYRKGPKPVITIILSLPM